MITQDANSLLNEIDSFLASFRIEADSYSLVEVESGSVGWVQEYPDEGLFSRRTKRRKAIHHNLCCHLRSDKEYDADDEIITYYGVYEDFKALCPSYETYCEFLYHYHRLSERGEELIKRFKKGRMFPHVFQSEAQSFAAQLANSITVLIWLRGAGKAWRRDTIKSRQLQNAA